MADGKRGLGRRSITDEEIAGTKPTTVNSIEKKLIKKRRALSKHYPRLFARVAEDYLYAEEPKKALKTAVKGVKTDPEFMPGQWLLAQSLAATDRVSDAVMHVTTMLEKEGFDRYGAALLAELYEREGEFDGALRLWTELYQLDPFDLSIERKLSKIIAEQIQHVLPEQADTYKKKLTDGFFLYSAAASLMSGEQLAERLQEAANSLDGLATISNPEMMEVKRTEPEPVEPPPEKPRSQGDTVTETIAASIFTTSTPPKPAIPKLPVPEPFKQLLTSTSTVEPALEPTPEPEPDETEDIKPERTSIDWSEAMKSVVKPVKQPLEPQDIREPELEITIVEIKPSGEETSTGEETGIPNIEELEAVKQLIAQWKQSALTTPSAQPEPMVAPAPAVEPQPDEFAELVTETTTIVETPPVSEVHPVIAAEPVVEPPAPPKPISAELMSEMPESQSIEPETEVTKPRRKPRLLASRTIAELYVKQDEYQRAIEVYRELLKQQPDREDFRVRINELETLAATQPLTRSPNEESD